MSDKRTGLTQREKHDAFKVMAEQFASRLEKGDFIAAHVVAFSFLEDRISAMHAVRVSESGSRARGFTPFGQRVSLLLKAGDLSPEEAGELKACADTRNGLFHTAMWNLDGFTAEESQRTFALARSADKYRRRQKLALGK